MEATFSEFSYGYALTEELASGKLGPLLGFPIFPSLRQEGQTGGGYDVQVPTVGSPLFLQFKLSHFLYRPNALEWDLFNGPYYRMYLRPTKHSDQHNLLMSLEKNNNEVYYVAPGFHTAPELNEAYLGGNVTGRSAFFSPIDIGKLPDDDLHYVVFTPLSSEAYLCSGEPGQLVRFHIGKVFVENELFKVRQKMTKVNEAFFDRISHQMLDIIREPLTRLDQFESLETEATKKRETLKEKAQFAGYLCRAYFDVGLFVVTEESS